MTKIWYLRPSGGERQTEELPHPWTCPALLQVLLPFLTTLARQRGEDITWNCQPGCKAGHWLCSVPAEISKCVPTSLSLRERSLAGLHWGRRKTLGDQDSWQNINQRKLGGFRWKKEKVVWLEIGLNNYKDNMSQGTLSYFVFLNNTLTLFFTYHFKIFSIHIYWEISVNG